MISLYCRTNQKFFHQSFFTPPPPGSCHPLFTFPYPYHLPDLLQPACFSACLLFVLPLLSVVVRVSWTDRCVDVVSLYSHTVRTIPGHRQSSTCAEFLTPFSPTRPVKPENVCPSAPLPPPCPRCGRDHKPNGPFTLVVWFLHTTHDLGTVHGRGH